MNYCSFALTYFYDLLQCKVIKFCTLQSTVSIFSKIKSYQTIYLRTSLFDIRDCGCVTNGDKNSKLVMLFIRNIIA